MQTCPVCNKEFEVRYKWRPQVYCSKECWSRRSKRHEAVCIGCGKKGLNKYGKKYCSRDCAHKQTNEKANAYKGDDVGYSGVHKFIVSRLGRPKECFYCGGSMPRVEWANISGHYKRDANDWIYLCSSCHRYFDRNGEWHSLIMDEWNRQMIHDAQLD